jgi:hypothetical protein
MATSNCVDQRIDTEVVQALCPAVVAHSLRLRRAARRDSIRGFAGAAEAATTRIGIGDWKTASRT